MALVKSVLVFFFVCCAKAVTNDSTDIFSVIGVTSDVLLAEAKDIFNWTVGIRRKLHMQPEIMYDLNETSAFVRATLDDLGISYKYPVARSGIVATIGTGNEPVFALRADMDALPILEIPSSDTLDFVSRQPGAMHACGHDAHTAMLLGAARLLKARETSIRGTVRLLFQPAEEGGAGAYRMMQEGAMDYPPVRGVFGVHVWPGMPTGHVGSRAGRFFAGAGFFEAVIRGKGGHAAVNIGHGVVDPVVAAAAAITSLQSVVARDLSPFSEGVISVSKLRAGDAYNVIPDTVVLGGTIRAYSREDYELLERRTRDVILHTALAHGCAAELSFTSFDAACLRGDKVPAYFPSGCTYPPVVNDKDAWAEVREVAEGLIGPAAVYDEVRATMGGEDFAYLAERAPGVFALLGVGNPAINSTAGLHTPQFKLDEAALPVGAALHVLVALRALRRLGGLAPAAPKLEL